jgi:hypothetical protein
VWSPAKISLDVIVIAEEDRFKKGELVKKGKLVPLWHGFERSPQKPNYLSDK